MNNCPTGESLSSIKDTPSEATQEPAPLQETAVSSAAHHLAEIINPLIDLQTRLKRSIFIAVLVGPVVANATLSMAGKGRAGAVRHDLNQRGLANSKVPMPPKQKRLRRAKRHKK